MAIIDIHKAAGILIRDRKLLVTRAINKEFFVAPSGKLEGGESSEEALVRELFEELSIKINVPDITVFGSFEADAAGQTGRILQMEVFFVETWTGDIVADNEIEELRWITSVPDPAVKLGSIFEHKVIPRLKALDLID